MDKTILARNLHARLMKLSAKNLQTCAQKYIDMVISGQVEIE